MCCHIRGEEEDDDNDKEEEEEEEEEEDKEEEAGCCGWEDKDNGGSATTTVIRTITDPALNLEIAWENLDLAHAIVTRLVDDLPLGLADDDDGGGKIDPPPRGDVDKGRDDTATSPRTMPAGGRQDKLLLDLAQIHVRLGNLGWQNNNVRLCVNDYDQALSLRTGVLGRYDKKVANCHFGLAQAYTKAPSKIKEGEGRVNAFVSNLVGRPSGGGGGEGRQWGGVAHD